MKRLVLALALWFIASTAVAQVPCPEGHFCVPKAEMTEVFLPLLKAQKCRTETEPTFELDPIAIITDRQGRVYFTGNEGPKPYKIKVNWCNYEIYAEAKVEVHVAQREEPTWGYRGRFKATFGVLGTELLERSDWKDSLDGGLMWEPFYFMEIINLNAYVGVRSFGAGVGVDITANFGGYAGLAITWGGWRMNPMASLFFSF